MKKLARFLRAEGEVNYLFIAFFLVIYLGMFGTMLAVSTTSYSVDRFVRELAQRVSIVASFHNRDTMEDQIAIFHKERDRMLDSKLGKNITRCISDLQIGEVEMGNDYPHNCYRISISPDGGKIRTFLGNIRISSTAYFFLRRNK